MIGSYSIVVDNRFPFFHHRPPSHSPPLPPIITQLDLRVRYHRRSKTVSTVTIKWTLPTARTDGSPVAASDIAGSQIFDATSPTPLVPIGSVNGPAVEFTTDTETVGIHNFSVEVTDTGGHQSGMSNVASVDVPAVIAPPNPPTDVTATLNP